MSDFHQPGLICTLQRLTETDTKSLESELEALAKDEPISLVLPCHYSDLRQSALAQILLEISGVKYLREIIVSMNGLDEDGFRFAQNYFSSVHPPCRILWNDGPALQSLYRRLGNALPEFPVSGKGLNTWAAFGLVMAEDRSHVLVTQDCDVISFQRETLARLCFSSLRPELAYDYSKMYYSRVTDRLYGRVSRLFLTPLLHALMRVAGHHPLLDFLLNFRYPLSGEYAIRRRLIGTVSLRGDWGLEIGLLCEVFRGTDPNRVCQVDGGGNHDHKHHPLGSEGGGPLFKMSKQIAHTLFTHLLQEGLPMTKSFLPALQTSYLRESSEALKRYKNLAIINGLPFDVEEEQRAADIFSNALGEALSEGGATHSEMPSWNLIASEHPDFIPQFLSVVAEINN